MQGRSSAGPRRQEKPQRRQAAGDADVNRGNKTLKTTLAALTEPLCVDVGGGKSLLLQHQKGVEDFHS